MAQHQRPIGPTGTNTAAPFAPDMVSDARPRQPQLGKPRPVGWVTSQTTHVAAPFSLEMAAGAHPDRSRDWLPLRLGWSVSQTTHVAAPFSAEMVAGWHPDSPRPYVAPRALVSGWQTSQTTHTSAPFSVEMVAGTSPTQALRVARTVQWAGASSSAWNVTVTTTGWGPLMGLARNRRIG